jgi:hypothetical protein
MGDKVFRCENCGALMLENGEIIVTLFDRVEGFIKYPKLIQAINDLEFMVAQNQHIASKHSEEILNLKNELNNVNSDKDLILKKLTELMSKIKKEAA